eukprot:7901671-Pyramimonas_sp.AAC.1
MAILTTGDGQRCQPIMITAVATAMRSRSDGGAIHLKTVAGCWPIVDVVVVVTVVVSVATIARHRRAVRVRPSSPHSAIHQSLDVVAVKRMTADNAVART